MSATHCAMCGGLHETGACARVRVDLGPPVPVTPPPKPRPVRVPRSPRQAERLRRALLNRLAMTGAKVGGL